MIVMHRTAAWKWWELYDAGITSRDDPRLVPVPSTEGADCVLHWAAAAVFRALATRWQDAHPQAQPLLVCSGWRPRKAWQATPAAYEAELVRRYRKRLPAAKRAELIAYGKLRLAYRSAHFTGLALDFGSPWPMRPLTTDKAVEQMQRSEVYDWLMKHALAHGLRNYLPEPHHWELPIPSDAWLAPGPEAEPK